MQKSTEDRERMVESQGRESDWLQEIATEAEWVVEASGGVGVLPKMEIIHRADGRSYKVRVYPTERAAEEKRQLLRKLNQTISIPIFCGRSGKSLVFEYAEFESPRRDQAERIFLEIGKFLGRLAGHQLDPSMGEILDGEFHQWLVDLERISLLSPSILRAVECHYQQLRPQYPSLVIDYWDAMPHNFGFDGDTLLLLDEKHLCYSFEGVGLIKPMLVLKEPEWQWVLQGYESIITLDRFWDTIAFLKLYYMMAALHFYNMKIDDGVKNLAANPRLRLYYSQLIERVLDLRLDQVLEILRFNLTFLYPYFRVLWRKLSYRCFHVTKTPAGEEQLARS